jgi:hypothetical protein
MALALKNIIKTRANYRILTIMQGCGFSKPWLKRVHQEIFFIKDPKLGIFPLDSCCILHLRASN